jgi:hypothetical protein
MKLVCLDTEFTSLHAYATLISVGLVTWEGEELYVCVDDYARDQVTPWIEENVLTEISPQECVSSAQACQRVEAFLSRYAGNERIALLSAGKMTDHLLLFQLWHTQHPQDKYFHFSKLPYYLYHNIHLDLHTLFVCAGYDPEKIEDRAVFAHYDAPGVRHNALHDARVVRACVQRLIAEGKLPELAKALKL